VANRTAARIAGDSPLKMLRDQTGIDRADS